MYGTKRAFTARALIGAAITLALAAPLGAIAPTPAAAATRAHKITRSRVLDRSKTWIKRRVSYSQNGTYRGYRRDCSGFVSMAWKLGDSYTTRSLDDVSRKVKRSSAKPGDAVLYPGHVVIFAKWKNKKAGTFVAYEQTTWGSHAKRKVRSMSGGTVLRRRGITDTPKPAEMTVTRVAAPQPTTFEPDPATVLAPAVASTNDGGITPVAGGIEPVTLSAVFVGESALH